MINYAIPGVYSHFELNVNLIHLIKDHPEFFYDNIGIDAVFGIFLVLEILLTCSSSSKFF